MKISFMPVRPPPKAHGALNAIGLGLPPKRITVNLAPADLPKEGSHYDLPIALGLMAAVGAVTRDAIEGYCVLGELALDGSIATVAGALPAAIGPTRSARAGEMVWLMRVVEPAETSHECLR